MLSQAAGCFLRNAKTSTAHDWRGHHPLSAPKGGRNLETRGPGRGYAATVSTASLSSMLERSVGLCMLFAALSCGAASPASEGGDRDGCQSLSKPATDQVLAEIEQHLSCAEDADCVSIGVASACFDHCSRAVNQAGVNAVKSALANADCREFVAADCSVIPPPCAPPSSPICNEGRCE